MYKQTKKRRVYFFMLFLTIVFNSKNIFAQVTILGPTEVFAGDIASYTFSDPNNTYFPGGWESDGDLQIDENQYTGYLPYMDVVWTTDGHHVIEISYLDSYGYIEDYAGLDVIVSYKFMPLPPRVVSNTEGIVTLGWAIGQSPPPSAIWYWQSTDDGEVMSSTPSNSLSTFDVMDSGTYYLRAYNPQTDQWSDASSVTYTVAPPPIWYYDSDGDGFGNTAPTITDWAQPVGYVDNNIDHCPSTAGIYEGCPTENNENYIHTIQYQHPYQESSLGNGIPVGDKIETITYFDGLGRPKQNIGIRAGGNSEDIVMHIGHDAYGRQDKDYLPYALPSGGGLFRDDALAATSVFYDTEKYESTLNPYSEKNLEASPLSRILEQGAPGADWEVDRNSDSDHTIKFEYLSNTVPDFVKRYEVSFQPTYSPEDPHLADKGTYGPNELYKTITKDENWKPNQAYPQDHTTEEYKDKQGRIILKRTFDLGKWHDTYYVYDEHGNLTFVLPPKISTYKSILQQNWRGKYFYFDPVLTLSDPEPISSYIEFDFSPNGILFFYMYAYNPTPFVLTDGLIMNLDFIDASLPDMSLGNIQFQDGTNAGSAYIQSGNLYIDSSGLSYSGSGSNYVDVDHPIDLSSYQNTFTPPPVDQAQLDELAYQYKYDGRNRLIEKKIPGKGWEEIVYNKLDQPILTRDPNLKAQNKWLFTKYDAFGRVAYTGAINSNSSRADLQASAYGATAQFVSKIGPSNIAGTAIYYDNGAYPTTVSEIYTINYYDGYDFDIGNGTSEGSYGTTPINNAKGLATGSKVRVLGSNPVKWITTVTYYDKKSQPIYVYNHNDYLGTTDKAKSEYDFVKVLGTTTTHAKTGQITISTIDAFTYDHAGRLVSQTQNINGQGEELIVKNYYDGLGQLVKKDVGNSEVSPLQLVDYTYNVRGWLKTINDPTNLNQDGDLFSFGLNYNRPEGPSTSYNTPLYNGNISHSYWKTDNIDGGLRHYSYRYDALNRFTYAFFAENQVYNSKFNESIYDYDRNGNIGRLFRYGKSPVNGQSSYPMDYLTYSYDGNRLLSVNDNYGTNTTSNAMGGFKDGNPTGNDYAYDPNGNMVEDKNKGITSIAYNHLNLPTNISINGDGGSGNISYFYDATGVKLKKEVSTGETTEYAGNYVYQNGYLKFFGQPEGYVEPKNESNLSQGFVYVYQYKDHLGNVRLSYKDSDQSSSITGATSPVFYDNLDNNSSSGWDSAGALYGSSAQLDGAHAMSSGTAIKLHLDTAGDTYAHSNDWIAINNSVPTDYIFSGWIYLESTGGSWARLTFFLNEGTETDYFTEAYSTDNVSTKGRWVYVEKRVTASVNIDKINLRVDLYQNSTSATAWFDNLSIRKANAPNEIEIVEENNYYPFGLEHKGYNKDNITSTNIALKRKFGGKELQDELGLDWYDITARNYDPAIGRWMNIDPLSEMMRSQSTYNYAFNNPINLIDEDGNAPSVPDNEIVTVTKVRESNSSSVTRESKVHVTLTVVNLSSNDLSTTMFAEGKGTIQLDNFKGVGKSYISSDKSGRDSATEIITEATIDYQVVTSLDDVREGDNVLFVTDNEIQNTGKDDVVGYNMEDGFTAVEAKTIEKGTFDNVATHETGHDLGGNHGVPDGYLMSAEGNSDKVHRQTRGDIIWSAAGYSDKEGVYENTNIKNRSKKDIAKMGNEIIKKYGL